MAYERSDTAKRAMQIAHDSQKQLLKIMESMDGNLEPIAKGIQEIQGTLFKSIDGAIKGMDKLTETIKDVGDGLADFLG